jgi:hypothetical protein
VPSFPSSVRLLSLAWAALAAPLSVAGCASQQCDFHSQCGDGFYCEVGRCKQDCRRAVDCAPGQTCNEIGQCVAAVDGGPDPLIDAGPTPVDAGPPPPRDSGTPPPRDSGTPPPPRDSGTPPPPRDSGPPPGTGAYLDRCTGDGDCATGHCVDDVGGTRMCTIACSAHRDCASEHVCGADGLCHPDDTGITCSLSSPESCELGLCAGTSATGTGQCTRPCDSAVDCPAGYACTQLGGSGPRVCVDIEKPCSGPEACTTGLCLTAQGCTAECRTAADCPRRLPFLPQYTCEIAFGSSSPICVPPDDILGADPIGASCSTTGTVTCRSGGCDPAAPPAPMCTQACTQEGGCGPGFGCFPQPDGSGGLLLACTRAGNRAIGEACSSGRECASGLCDALGSVCTRLCTDDGLCPTGMSCVPETSFSPTVSICRP